MKRCWPPRKSPIWRVICSTAGCQGGLSQSGQDCPWGPAAGSPCRCPILFASSVIGAEFQELVRQHVDILFANEAEAMALFQTDFDGAVRQLRDAAEITVITRGEKGSIVIAGDRFVIQDAERISTLVDTTGAGDLFAAGFLAGYTRGDDLGLCAKLGGLCAADVIGHIGARPSKDLGIKVKQATLGPV